jgi:DNA-binding SARP family transcriptional activator
LTSELADDRERSGAALSAGVASEPEPGDGSLRLQILGPLRLWRGNVELDPGPRQQGVLLAVLLAKADQPVSRAELIDLIWHDNAPVSAPNVIHKYVGVLRRVLEPGLAVRTRGSHLLRSGDGYLFESENSGLDLVDFRNHVRAARVAVSREQYQEALDSFVAALALWRGAAGEGMGLGPAPLFVALNGEFLRACVAAGDLAVRTGQPGRVLPALRLAASMAPLDEDVHAALVHNLGAAGHRTEALHTSRKVCARLADELGVDPGPALRSAQRRVLAEIPTSATASDRSGETVGTSDDAAAGLIGRAEELNVLADAVRSARRGGTNVLVVDGEPGVGKTRLLKEMTGWSERRGALVVWGTCMDGDGTPPMWPWVEMVRAIVDSVSAEERTQWMAGGLGRLVETAQDTAGLPVPPDDGSRFRLFEQVVGLVRRIAARRPMVLVVDDLHWADVATLQLLGHLSLRLPRGAVVVGALRDRAPLPGTELSRFLSTVSRNPGHHRISLGPLAENEVAELVRRETGKVPGFGAVRTIYERTAGNPLFVRELSRLLATAGAATAASVCGAGVPSSVHDIVRSRTADLSNEERRLLQTAALVGRHVNVSLLAHATAVDVPTCLTRLESLTALGVLEPVPGDPFSVRFPHDLVRESVAVMLPPRRATELHLRIADALDAGITADDSVTERLAHHLWAAGPLAEPSRTAAALVRAGRRAGTNCAFETAERSHWAAAAAQRAGELDETDVALDRSGRLSDVHDERFTECLRLLLRAMVLHARDEPSEVVRAAAAQARALADERGAHVIARRAVELMNFSG